MEEEIYVSCHAPTLSFLLFETARSVHDQKGLLIGEICNEVISKKTDENEVNCERKTAIYLEHCIPLNEEDISSGGAINKSKFQKLTSHLQNKIVGWYSFRRNTRLLPNSLSEFIIHQSLLDLTPNAKSQYFVACFMSSSTVASMSTHMFNHIFMTYDPFKARFESLKLKIYTLSDKCVNSNGYLVKNQLPISNAFDKIISYVNKSETPVQSVLEIHEKVSEVLNHSSKKLQTLENFKVQLEEEVKTLKKQLGITKKENISVEEPYIHELKVKTIAYDPERKYKTTREVNPLKAIAVKPLVPVNIKEEQGEEDVLESDSLKPRITTTPETIQKFEPKKSYSSVTSSSTLHQTMTQVSTNNSSIDSPTQVEDCSKTSSSQTKISDSSNIHPPKPMEY